MEEVQAQLLQRFRPQAGLADATSLKVGEWLVEPLANRITQGDRHIVLRAQVMELLVYLANRGDQVTSLETMHDELWRGKIVSSGTVYNCIAELRQALTVADLPVRYIETIPKRGYRLVAQVHFPALDPGAATTGSVVAVLPLRNRSGPESEYLCEGISEEIVHCLSNAAGLKVVSALSLTGLNLDNREVGRRFAADFVLTGSLQRDGTRLRLSFRMENVHNGQVILSEHRDQEFSDIFEIQEDVARQVVNVLVARAKLLTPIPSLPEHSDTRDPRALNDFLLGRHAFSTGAADSYNAAIVHFESAIAHDPDFARAHYCLYLACYFRTRYFPGSATDSIQQTRRAAERARECGYRPAVPWVHIHRRLHKDARISTVEMGREAIDKLRSGDPEWSSFAYEQMTWVLSASGFFKAALEFNRRALYSPSLNFQDSDVDEELPNWEAGAGYFHEAIRRLSRLIQKDPRCASLRHDRCTLYCRTGLFDKADEEIAALEAMGMPTRNARIIRAYWHGELAEVHRLLAEEPSRLENRPMFQCVNDALIGNLDRAAELFCQATDARTDIAFVDLGYMRAKARYTLPLSLVAQLEGHSRFQRMLESEGINAVWRHWLKNQLNALIDLSGIVVECDE